MGSLGNNYENQMLDSMLGDDHSARFPADVYVGLFTTTPTDAAYGIEVAFAGDYDRILVPNDSANWPDAINATKQNLLDIEFAVPTADWGLVKGWAILDDPALATIAHIIAYGAFSAPVNVLNGSTAPKIAAYTLGLQAN